MLIEQERLHPPDENQRLGFMELLGRFESYESFQIMSAYDIAEDVHKRQNRATGERYFSHPRNVALSLMSLGIDNANVISGALLHDVIEDVLLINGLEFINNKQWLKVGNEWMKEEGINPQVRKIVTSLTKPKIDNIDIFTVEQRRYFAIENVRFAPPEAQIIKMADRLHNLQTLNALSEGKAQGIIWETQNILYSALSKTLQDKRYAKYARRLFLKMEDAICEFRHQQFS